jgi:ATP-dependent DNA helicase UvrD/PcrA
MREFEERFITLGLPYEVIGGPRFYERAEIRDALAYLRCVAQPADDLAFERIFNVPKRGLGDATLQLLHDHARRARIPLMQAARIMIETEELKPKQRQTLRGLLSDFDRWASQIDQKPQGELAETILEESGYTDMWQKDRTAEAAGRLENLKELVRSMEEFPDLGAFLEHISLVMDVDNKDGGARVSIMTLHAAKGLEFETVFLPGWEEGLFPHQRSLDESGRAGLEEERRLAYVGLTRAKRIVKIYFATNRRIHGLWQTTIPSRFLDELPADHVEVVEAPTGAAYGGYAQSRFANMDTYTSSYSTPGWQRAQRRRDGSGVEEEAAEFNGAAPRRTAAKSQTRMAARGPMTIEGELVAKSSVGSAFEKGVRVFHIKFGYGKVAAVDGNKLTVDFDKAGRKMVLESFLQPG